MSNNHLLLRNLYFSASGKYLKFKTRYEKAIQSGRFYKLNKQKQSTLVSRLKRLYERLRSLQTQLRLAGAGAGLALTLAFSNPTQAQSTLGPFESNTVDNPLPRPIVVRNARPAVVDIDGDGDLDVFVGDQNGDIKFFRNVGTSTLVRRFKEESNESNPLSNFNFGYNAAPAFSDIDGDGDYDLLVGNGYGFTYFFINTGTATNPVFIEESGILNPFDGIRGSVAGPKYDQASPVFVDIDNDGDVDLFVGSGYIYGGGYGTVGAVKFYENNSGEFTETTHPLVTELYLFNNTQLAFADLDGDGDKDVYVGVHGEIQVFINNGSSFSFGGFYQNIFEDLAAPAMGDFDGDGDLEIIVGQRIADGSSSIRYFEITPGTGFLNTEYSRLNESPFGGVDVGSEAVPVFTDLDGDGDLDVVIGAKYDVESEVYINNNGVYEYDEGNIILDVIGDDFEHDTIPVFVDIDNDGDNDLFICRNSTINFFRNEDGDYISEIMPFPFLTGQEMSLAFVDMDNDGDFDAFIGNSEGGNGFILYYRNDGTASTPSFVRATEEETPDPFDNFLLSYDSNPNVSGVDLDNDGDTDIVLSETYYLQSGYAGDKTRVRFFENNGDGTFTDEGFIIADGSPRLGFTSFADIDGDGDLDAFLGNGSEYDNGTVSYFENTNPPPVTNVISTTREVTGGVATILDPLLTISDPDNDDIVSALVTISDFLPGEEVLGFTPQAGIEGVFDDEEGVLTFTGRGTITEYQALLRSVTFNFTGDVPGGRKSKSGRVSDLAQDITFQVRDTDFTLATVSVVTLTISPGSPGSEINIFNALSPNGDDSNDFFEIRYLESISPKNKVTILNRWGDVVYEVSNYNNDTKRFEGVSDNGNQLPSGTYFYKIEITGQTITGYLSLKR